MSQTEWHTPAPFDSSSSHPAAVPTTWPKPRPGMWTKSQPRTVCVQPWMIATVWQQRWVMLHHRVGCVVREALANDSHTKWVLQARAREKKFNDDMAARSEGFRSQLAVSQDQLEKTQEELATLHEEMRSVKAKHAVALSDAEDLRRGLKEDVAALQQK